MEGNVYVKMGNLLIGFLTAFGYIAGFGSFMYGMLVREIILIVSGIIFMIVGYALDKTFLMEKNG